MGGACSGPWLLTLLFPERMRLPDGNLLDMYGGAPGIKAHLT